jgi:hypothetical protein
MLRRFLLPLFPLALGTLFFTSNAKADPFASEPSADANETSTSSSPTQKPMPPPPPPPAAAHGPRDSWYGHQILTIDLSAASLTAIGAFTQHSVGGVLAVGGISAYALGGPIVHWAHGHVGRGFGSLAMRVGIPAVTAVTGMLIGFAVYEPPHREGFAAIGAWLEEYQAGIYGFIIGGAVGTAGASVIDSVALAREHSPANANKPSSDDDATPRRSMASRSNSSKPTWQPTFAPTRGGGFQAGVGGTF